MASREELHRLIDELPEVLAGQVLDFVQFLRQKETRQPYENALAALNAVPVDDEPDTDEEREEARQAFGEYKREGGVRLEDLQAELDL
ncbi:MAG: hypothetical protein JWM80_5074 [Cyanobacteria bacterium RYN_339]|nr:hypothetical protein [Cyanobacteria bacterium RYN_339]